MKEITTAREKLLEQERLRPGPGHFSALWEGGESWRHAFEELAGTERARDTLFEQRLDTAQSFEARREHLQQWSGVLNESLDWYNRLRSMSVPCSSKPSTPMKIGCARPRSGASARLPTRASFEMQLNLRIELG